MFFLGMAALLGFAGGFSIQRFAPNRMRTRLIVLWAVAPGIALAVWAILPPSGAYGGWTPLVAVIYSALPLSLWGAGSALGFFAGRRLP